MRKEKVLQAILNLPHLYEINFNKEDLKEGNKADIEEIKAFFTALKERTAHKEEWSKSVSKSIKRVLLDSESIILEWADGISIVDNARLVIWRKDCFERYDFEIIYDPDNKYIVRCAYRDSNASEPSTLYNSKIDNLEKLKKILQGLKGEFGIDEGYINLPAIPLK